ncbi:outer membrane protein assembly factor BamA [Jannaschia sp. W003]|uniref:outer membrane protein assembly factor BamA n=1 Tax=Jannaschia sp. W003 TaxID=2867012 RepID=UPI0021A8744D|nr:outer membrane protein assembly factor BamA [Jannaschia sp. W003]UWQ20464.1 outer membrane protein assembly factor BamA [Jannaschia sp. W003]
MQVFARGACRFGATAAGTLGAVALAGTTAFWFAGAAEAQTFRFTSFDVQGNQRIDDATVISTLGVTPGQPIGAGPLNDGFQRLQASGLFESVEIVPSGERLVVVVREFPTISRIAIEGNARIKDDQLLELVRSTPRRVYDPAQAEADAAAIAAAYGQAGRLAATVSPKIIRRSDNRVDLVFEVAEGRVTEVERVGIVGNRAFSDRRLRRVLETTQAGIFRAVIGSDTLVPERLEFDRQLLRDFYLSRGYVDVEVLSVTPELAPTRDAFFLTFRIREGQQFRFGQVGAATNLGGVDAAEFGAEVPVQRGDVYSPQAVERTIERLERLATRKGLNFVRVVPRVTRNEAARTLDVAFVIERGPRVFVERIDIEGNATTLDRVIRRQFRIAEGDPFDPREIRAAAERIRALGYFADASVEARDGSAADQVIVDVDVEEQPTGSLGFGLSFSVDAGASLALTFAETNFLGRGQSLNLAVNVGSTAGNSQLTFVEPAFLGRDLALSTSLYYSETDPDDENFALEQLGFRPGLEFPVGEYARLGVFYNIDRATLISDDPGSDVNGDGVISPGEGLANVSAILAREANEERITSSVGYRYVYNTIGDGLDPTRGYRLTLEQEVAGLGGDEKFVKSAVTAQGEQLVLNEEVTLRGTLSFGALVQLEDTVSTRSNRYFGTGNLIRGFRSGGIGPRDTFAPSDPLGGNRFVQARAEALFPIGILPEEYGISGAAFVDAASVWGLDDTDGGAVSGDGVGIVDDGFFLNSSVGVSILWDTAIGPLRFDFTEAIRKRDFDREQNFDLTIQTRF